MSETKSNAASLAAVPDEAQQNLLASSAEVQTRVGPVAKFSSPKKFEQQIDLDQVDDRNDGNEFIGLTKEELKEYINSDKWKRIRKLIMIGYLLMIVVLLCGSVFLVLTSPRCPPKKELTWFEREIIYEVDVPVFRDSDADGVGDIRGLIEQLPYIEKNQIQSILLESSIFNVSIGISTKLDGTDPIDKKFNLKRIDPKIGKEKDLDDLVKILLKKNMHLIIDLPLASTFDPKGRFWYGHPSPLDVSIENPCAKNKLNLGCRYYEAYGRFPLDFNLDEVSDAAEELLKFWLLTKKFDGVRVDLPMEFNNETRTFEISERTIKSWIQIKKSIEEKTRTKVFLFDVPTSLNDLIEHRAFNNETAVNIFPSKFVDSSPIKSRQLAERFEILQREKPKFWKLGSKRRSDELGIPNEQQIPREILLTLMMLTGPTPIFLYADELSIDQKNFPFMAWNSDPPSGGFSACSEVDQCPSLFSTFRANPMKNSVKRQEAIGGQSKESLLRVFRRLASLRSKASFLFSDLVFGHNEDSNLFWFVREAPGHPGFVVFLNLSPTESAHVSIPDLTEQKVPVHVHYEFQWPKVHFPPNDSTHIDSDNLIVDPQSINIFWWKPKLINQKIF